MGPSLWKQAAAMERDMQLSYGAHGWDTMISIVAKAPENIALASLIDDWSEQMAEIQAIHESLMAEVDVAVNSIHEIGLTVQTPSPELLEGLAALFQHMENNLLPQANVAQQQVAINVNEVLVYYQSALAYLEANSAADESFEVLSATVEASLVTLVPRCGVRHRLGLKVAKPKRTLT